MNHSDTIRRSTKHEKKLRWLAENEAMLEAKHPGMWVAIGDDGLAGLGPTLEEARASAIGAGVVDPLLSALRAKEYQDVPLIRRCR